VEMKAKEMVYKILREDLDVTKEELKDDAELEKLGMDELDKVEITMSLEEEFNLTITDEDTDKWVKVGDVVKYIEREVE